MQKQIKKRNITFSFFFLKRKTTTMTVIENHRGKMIRRSTRIESRNMGVFAKLANTEPHLLKFIIEYIDDEKTLHSFILSSVVKQVNKFCDKILYTTERLTSFFSFERTGKNTYCDMVSNYITDNTNKKLYFLNVLNETKMILYKNELYEEILEKYNDFDETLLTKVIVCYKMVPPTGNRLKRIKHEIKILLEGGVDINETDVLGPAINFSIAFDIPSIFQILITHESINVNKRYEDNCDSTLAVACDSGNPYYVKELLKFKSIDVNLANSSSGCTPLYHAVAKGNFDVVQNLLKHSSIDVNKATTDNGCTPLIRAIYDGHDNIAKELLNHPSIDVNQASAGERVTPLSVCVDKNNFAIAKELLQRDEIDVNRGARNPLVLAAFTSRHDFVVELLHHVSIDVNTLWSDEGPDFGVLLASVIAFVRVNNNEPDCIKMSILKALLQHKSIDVNKATSRSWEQNDELIAESGFTALHAACLFDKMDVVTCLLQHPRIDMSKEIENSGETAAELAKRRGSNDIAYAIRKAENVLLKKKIEKLEVTNAMISDRLKALEQSQK